MDVIKLNVYNDDDEIVKTVEGRMIDLRFGTIRRLMELLKIEDVDDTKELLTKVYSAWEQLTRILSRVFPEMNEEDWDGVKLSELMPLLVLILKTSFVYLMRIPTDSKN